MFKRLLMLLGAIGCNPHRGEALGREDVPDITNPATATHVDKLPDSNGKSKGGTGSGGGYPSKFDFVGKDFSLTGAIKIGTVEQDNYTPTANYEISTQTGRVRLYYQEPEGKKGYLYIEATPGNPVQQHGRMIWRGSNVPYYILIESVEGEASGVAYHIWRK
jgi:hypothetical protein